MVNPQKEHGNFQIANEVAEQFGKLHLSGNEWQILWVVLRKTWGWNKKQDKISLTQFQKHTGLARTSLCEAMIKLVRKRVLLVEKSGLINEYRFNKRYNEWTSTENQTSDEVVRKSDITSTENGYEVVRKTVHTKNTITKNTIQKTVLSKDRTVALKKQSNRDVNRLIAFFKSTMRLPQLDGSEKQNRQYAYLLLKKFGTIEQCETLVQTLSAHKYWAVKVTSMQTLYYKAVNIMSSARDSRYKVEKV